MNNFNIRLESYVDTIQAALPDYLPRQKDLPYGAVCDAMAYSLLSGGKRIRGVLTLAFYNLFQSDVERALPFAAAIEMIHAYSLIHDDLPCMDNDDMRRGKPSCHIAFGETIALLAGDGLLNQAFETVTAPSSFPSETALTAAHILATASGVHGMIGGQVMDLTMEGKLLSAAELDGIHRCKTAALIRAAVLMGCCLGGANREQSKAAGTYADCVGLAFQIMDDLLDETADPILLGKPVGSDASNNKSTYASLYGVERCRELVGHLNTQAKEALAQIGLDTEFLASLADMLGGREF